MLTKVAWHYHKFKWFPVLLNCIMMADKFKCVFLFRVQWRIPFTECWNVHAGSYKPSLERAETDICTMLDSLVNCYPPVNTPSRKQSPNRISVCKKNMSGMMTTRPDSPDCLQPIHWCNLPVNTLINVYTRTWLSRNWPGCCLHFFFIVSLVIDSLLNRPAGTHQFPVMLCSQQIGRVLFFFVRSTHWLGPTLPHLSLSPS